MGLFGGSKSKSSSKSSVTNTTTLTDINKDSANANVGGSAPQVNFNLSDIVQDHSQTINASSGKKGKTTISAANSGGAGGGISLSSVIQQVDHGSVLASFDFAGKAIDEAFGFGQLLAEENRVLNTQTIEVVSDALTSTQNQSDQVIGILANQLSEDRSAELAPLVEGQQLMRAVILIVGLGFGAYALTNMRGK